MRAKHEFWEEENKEMRRFNEKFPYRFLKRILLITSNYIHEFYLIERQKATFVAKIKRN